MKKLLFCVLASMIMAGIAFAELTWEATGGDNPSDCKITWSEDSGATFSVSLMGASMYVQPCLRITESAYKSVSLEWDANSETNLAGYKIHFGLESRNYSKTYDVKNVTSYTVTGLSPGIVYYFAATAYDTDNNESEYSNEVTWQSDVCKIPHNELSIIGVSSEESLRENGRAINAIDGQQGTIWHTKYSQVPVPSHPHEIIIDVGKVRSLCGIDVMRRVVGENGTTKRYQIAIAEQDNWRVVAEGTVENIEDDIITSWPAVEGRMIRFIALEAFNDDPWTSVSEIDVFVKE